MNSLLYLGAVLLLLSPTVSSAQQLNQPPVRRSLLHSSKACISISVFGEKDGPRYEYLTGQTARGDLRQELAELKLVNSEQCRVNVFVDSNVSLHCATDLAQLAVDAGFTDAHTYWAQRSMNLVAEVIYKPGKPAEFYLGNFERVRLPRRSKGFVPLILTAANWQGNPLH
jgi:hypothetical protein